MTIFKKTIDRLISDRSENAMRLFVEKARKENMSDEDIAYLAKSMADSGTPLNSELSCETADIASTGGPTSLSTLLCPLYLRAFGFAVPKLGVPGRPAGGIDVLAQIPGYNIVLDSERILRSLERSGYVHFLASERYAPLDADLFAFRKRNGVLAMPEFVIASILSKKLAVGVKRVGLDIRVAQHGNFGFSWEEARNNAQRFCRVSGRLGIEAVCFLTDARIPYQPFIGRAESLLALAVFFDGKAGGSLKAHADMCFAMAASVARRKKDETLNQPSPMDLFYHFKENLFEQGSCPNSFIEYVAGIKQRHVFDILASHEGFLEIDIGRLRDLIVNLQNKSMSSDSLFPDPCGIILEKTSGEYVMKGDQIVTVRIFDSLWPMTVERLKEAFIVRPTPGLASGFEEVINA